MSNVIDFDSLLKEATKPVADETLFACICGPRGSGKSTLVSTTGLPTLLLSFNMESHGVTSARSLGATVANVFLDVDNEGNQLSADAVITKLKEILIHPELPKKFGAVALDSLSVFDLYVNQHSTVKSAQKYKEAEATETLYNDIIKLLRNLQAKKVHILCTLAVEAEIDKNTGESINVTPTLRGYNMVNKVLGAFSDIFLVGPVLVTEEDGSTEKINVIQFGGKFTKAGKKMSGEARSLTFNPRLSGVPSQYMPEEGYLPASLRKLIDFKINSLKQAREAFNAKK